MGDRLKVVERMSQETLLDAAAYTSSYVLDAIRVPFTTEEQFEKFLKYQKRLTDAPSPLDQVDNGQDLAIEYIKTEYIHRLKDIETQLTYPRFKNAYQLPWSILARALMYERIARYHALSESNDENERRRSRHFPVVLSRLTPVPGEMDMMDAIVRLSEESVPLMARGNMYGVVEAIEQAIAHEYGYPDDSPSPIRKGNLIKVDFEYLSKYGNKSTQNHNNGLTGAMRDLYLMVEYLEEKGQQPR